jgi:hypothetical protein
LPIVGTVQSVPMVQVEGCWVEGATPEEAQATWDTYKKELDKVANGSLRLGIAEENLLRNLSTLLDKLQAAPNRNAFHRAIDEGGMQLSPALNAWAGITTSTDPYGSGMYSDPRGPGSN